MFSTKTSIPKYISCTDSAHLLVCKSTIHFNIYVTKGKTSSHGIYFTFFCLRYNFFWIFLEELFVHPSWLSSLYDFGRRHGVVPAGLRLEVSHHLGLQWHPCLTPLLCEWHSSTHNASSHAAWKACWCQRHSVAAGSHVGLSSRSRWAAHGHMVSRLSSLFPLGGMELIRSFSFFFF